MRRVLADPELQAEFDRTGLVRMPMLETHEVAALLGDIAALKPADGFAPDGTGVARNSYHCTFLDTDNAYKRAAFDVLVRHFAPVIDRYLAGFRALSANFYVKPPGQGDFPIHQNWPVLADFDETSVTVWCPLVDVDERNGTLHVVPGSHKLLPHVEGPNSPAYFTPFYDRLYEHMKPLPAQAGTGFIFDDSIVHGSPPNSAVSPRIAVQITCVPSEAEPVFFFKDSEERFELFDADTDFYLDHGVTDLFARQPHWISRGFVDSRNRQIDEGEFLALLEQGDVIRRRGPGPKAPSPGSSRQQAGFVDRLRSIFR